MTDLTYRQWMKRIEEKVERKFGVGFDLLPDWMSRDAFEDGLTVEEGYEECLDQTGLREELESVIDEL